MLSGALGLQIIFRRLGVELGEQQFNKIRGIDEREITFREIKGIAHEHAINCRAIKTNIIGVSETLIKQPLLAHLNNGRYVIVIKVSSNENEETQITFIDPKASNPKPETINLHSFQELWSGTGFIFKKSRKLEADTGAFNLSAILDEIIADKMMAIQLTLIIIFINLFGLAPIIFLIIVLDKVVNYESYSTLYVIASGVLLAHVFNFFLSYYKTSIINLAAAKVEAKYGVQLFQQIINLPASTFEKQSAQFPNLGSGLNNIRQLIINKFLGIITDFISVIVFTPILLFYSPMLGSVVIGACLLNSAITSLHKRRSQSAVKELSIISSKRQELLNSISDGFIDIKRLGLEKDVIAEWKSLEGSFLKSNDKSLSGNAFISEIGTLINNILTVIVLFIGVNLVFAGALSAGVLIGVNMLIGKIFRPTQSLVEFPSEMKKLSALISSIADAGSLSSENIRSGSLHDILGSVVFDNVSYQKEANISVLENTSFSIDIHETLGICSNKPETSSTIAQLIQGLFPPSSGTILIDGNGTSTFNLQHLRSNISLIDKTNHFFPGTIRDNFQKVLPNANNDRINWACEMANLKTSMDELQISIDSDIENIQEFWTEDFKIKLSLARALIRNPKILIIDDIFSKMDASSILEFKQNFNLLSKSRTVILIAKHLYNLNTCNKLMFFENNKVAQFGNTAQILEQDGPAKELLKQQIKVISPKLENNFDTILRGLK